MKRKVIAILSLTLLVLCCAFGFVACKKDEKPDKDGEKNEHTHVYVDSVVEPTCTSGGYTLHTCACGDFYRDNEVNALGHDFSDATYLWNDDCSTCTALRVCKTDASHIELEVGISEKQITQEKTCVLDELSTYSVTFTNSGFQNQTKENVKSADKLGHDFSEEWTVDKESTCIEKGEKSHHCTRCEETADATETDFSDHTYKDEVCTVCGELEETTGLEYKLSDDGKYYIVTGLGTVTRTRLKIPSSYNGKPVKEIGEYAFSAMDTNSPYDFKVIKEVVLPDTITTIGEGSFSGCLCLTSITIPANVTSIGEDAFAYCYKLVEVVNNSNVTIEPGSFCDDPYELPFNVKKDGKSDIVDKDGYKFYTYDGVNYLLGYNGNDKSLTLPRDYNGEKYELFVSAFELSDIESVTISDGVTFIGEWAFSGCNSLTGIIIPDNVIEIRQGAFQGCESLLNVTIGNGVTEIDDYAFRNCKALTNVIFGSNVESIGCAAFDSCSSLISLTIPDKVTSFADGQFEDCSNLKYLIIGSGLKWFGLDAFIHCDSLESITVSTDNITYKSVSNCLIKIATNELVFGCKNSVIPDDDSVTSIGDGAFRYCTKLTSITIPDNVTSIGYKAFCGCSGLTSVTIPDSITSIGTGAFSDCSKLKYNEYDNAYYLGNDSNPYLVLIKAKDTSIISCTINDNTKVIAGDAFALCDMTDIIIPDKVISIGDCAFYQCSTLTSITIPNSLTSIGRYAFYNCSSLTRIDFSGTKEQWNAIWKDYSWLYNTGEFTIYCTDGEISKEDA